MARVKTVIGFPCEKQRPCVNLLIFKKLVFSRACSSRGFSTRINDTLFVGLYLLVVRLSMPEGHARYGAGCSNGLCLKNAPCKTTLTVADSTVFHPV